MLELSKPFPQHTQKAKTQPRSAGFARYVFYWIRTCNHPSIEVLPQIDVSRSQLSCLLCKEPYPADQHHHQQSGSESGASGVHPVLQFRSELAGLTYRFLVVFRQRSLNPNELLEFMSSLDVDLAKWRDALPSDWRPGNPLISHHHQRASVLLLWKEYYALLTMIFYSVSHCQRVFPGYVATNDHPSIRVQSHEHMQVASAREYLRVHVSIADTYGEISSPLPW